VRGLVRRWNGFWFEPGSATTLGVCRALFFGTLLLWQLPHDFTQWGAYSSPFWMPIWLFDTFNIPALRPSALGWIQLLWKVSLLLSAIGLFTRIAMSVAFVSGAYLMGLPHNFGQTQHFDTLVVFTSGALALSHAADAVSLDAWIARRRRAKHHRGVAVEHPAGEAPKHVAGEATEHLGGVATQHPAGAANKHLGGDAPATDPGEYTWPIRFVWVAMALIFCAAGISKWRHSGLAWVLSDNLALLLQRQQYHISDGEPWTNWGLWVARHRLISRLMAGASIGIETLYPLALFSRTARLVLVPAGLLFLLGIRTLMGPTFEQFMLCYIFWVPWERVLYNARSYATHLFSGRARAHAGAGDLPAADGDLAAGH